MILQQGSRDPGILGKQWLADAVLRSAVGCWWFVTFIGQWLFMYYLVALYSVPTLSGHFEDWEKKQTLFKGYIPGDTIGNLAFAGHVVFAAVIAFGGIVQIVPQIRSRAIAIHRWNGRAFLLAATVISIGGLYMVWVRHATFNLVNSVAVTLNAVLILIFVSVTWRAARVRDVDSHRRWALRTFLVANGSGYFIRVAFAAWSVFAPGVGTSDRADGPMNYVFEFGSYLVPLGVLEVYLRARDGASTLARFATAILLVALTAYMTAGTFAATLARRALLG